MRKLEVQEVERAPGLSTANRAEELLELRPRVVILALEGDVDVLDVQRAEQPFARALSGTVAESAPAISDRGQFGPEGSGQDAVHVRDTGVVEEASVAIGPRHAPMRLGAVPCRAESRHRLRDLEGVALAEECEEVLGMIRECRKLTRRRHSSRHHCRDRLGGELVHGRGTRIPDAVSCEPPEVRVPRLVQRSVRAEQELVGSSSSTTSTTGVRVRTDTSAPARSPIASGTDVTK